VVPFPPKTGAAGPRWPVSTNGGSQPLWRQDGKELYYLAPDGSMMAVDVLSPPPQFKAGVPHALIKTQIIPAFQISQYAVSANGDRFVLLQDTQRDSASQALRVIVDWPAVLETKTDPP
jgi:hypothetical protein